MIAVLYTSHTLQKKGFTLNRQKSVDMCSRMFHWSHVNATPEIFQPSLVFVAMTPPAVHLHLFG